MKRPAPGEHVYFNSVAPVARTLLQRDGYGDGERRTRAEREAWIDRELHPLRYSPAKAARLRRAVVEMLVQDEVTTGRMWTHGVDQTFKPALGVRTVAVGRQVLGGALALLPALLAPSDVYAVAESHRSGMLHFHSLWKAPGAEGVRQWWRGLKETLGNLWGWARVWPIAPAPTVAARTLATDYMLKHAVKQSPTTFAAKATWYKRRGYADGTVVVSWRAGRSLWTVTRGLDGSLTRERKVT